MKLYSMKELKLTSFQINKFLTSVYHVNCNDYIIIDNTLCYSGKDIFADFLESSDNRTMHTFMVYEEDKKSE